MGKLRASLYSLRAAGRLGGHRRAPGAALAAVGPMWHKDLLGLGADDHAQYPLSAGRAAGQTLIGGLASGEHLGLKATAHAVQGYVQALSDLQLVTGLLRSPAGTTRLTLADATPHVALSGHVDISQHLAVGSLASIHYGRALNISETLTLNPVTALNAEIRGARTAGPQFTYGLAGGAYQMGTPTYSFCYGLYYFAQHNTISACYQLGGIYIQQQSGAAGSGAVSIARGLYIATGYWGNAKPAQTIGADIHDQGHALVTTAYGLYVKNQTGITARLLECGPTVPYLRLMGGAAPAANTSHLYLNLGGTLKQVTEYNVNTAGAGFRALRVPN